MFWNQNTNNCLSFFFAGSNIGKWNWSTNMVDIWMMQSCELKHAWEIQTNSFQCDYGQCYNQNSFGSIYETKKKERIHQKSLFVPYSQITPIIYHNYGCVLENHCVQKISNIKMSKCVYYECVHDTIYKRKINLFVSSWCGSCTRKPSSSSFMISLNYYHN